MSKKINNKLLKKKKRITHLWQAGYCVQYHRRTSSRPNISRKAPSYASATSPHDSPHQKTVRYSAESSEWTWEQPVDFHCKHYSVQHWIPDKILSRAQSGCTKTTRTNPSFLTDITAVFFLIFKWNTYYILQIDFWYFFYSIWMFICKFFDIFWRSSREDVYVPCGGSRATDTGRTQYLQASCVRQCMNVLC